MYGDMRHIFVMQSELDNEIDFDDIQHSADKYSKAFNSHNQRQMKAKKMAVDRKNFRSDAEPYFRPAQRPSAVNSKQKTKPPKAAASNEPTDNNVLLDNLIKINSEAIVDDVKPKDETLSTPAESKKTTKLTSVSSSSTTPGTASKVDTEQYDESAFTKPAATTVDKVVLNLFNNISSALSSTTISAVKTSSIQSAVEESTEKLSSTLRNELVNSNDLQAVEEELEKEIFNDLVQATSNGEVSDETDAIDRNNSKEPQTTTTETQLFQDTVHKEKEPVPVVNRRGV